VGVGVGVGLLVGVGVTVGVGVGEGVGVGVGVGVGTMVYVVVLSCVYNPELLLVTVTIIGTVVGDEKPDVADVTFMPSPGVFWGYTLGKVVNVNKDVRPVPGCAVMENSDGAHSRLSVSVNNIL
jgi:hypothetical protein